MNIFFFLKTKGLKSEIGIAHFPPTRSKGYQANPAYVCAARIVQGKWFIQTLTFLAYGQSYAVKGEALNLSDDLLSQVVVFLSPKRLEGAYDELPSESAFTSTASWRANVRIVSPTTSTSYMAEYPGEMLDLKRGSNVSVAPFYQSGAGICAKVFIVNFSRQPIVKEGNVYIKLHSSQRILKHIKVMSNRVSCLDLTDVAVIDETDSLVVVSPDLAFIPIYFSQTQEGTHLSLEHSHPPASLMMYGLPDQKRAIARQMKSYFMRGIERA